MPSPSDPPPSGDGGKLELSFTHCLTLRDSFEDRPHDQGICIQELHGVKGFLSLVGFAWVGAEQRFSRHVYSQQPKWSFDRHEET